ncbi:hypothetical protein MRB53_025777 [Persea americana]|uniref:Uncharacterized protein n=1 Tax=Persea americana TaxID=3435 RepID=A0ACC2LG57_PERAE|nr:hypothetical protein MRB53_025777 [Persea americana]
MKKYTSITLSAQCILFFLLISYEQHLSTASENAANKMYIVYMGERKHSDPSLVVDSHHNVLATVLGTSKETAADSIIYHYKHGFSGFATMLTDSQAKMMAEMPGVVDVIPKMVHKLHTTRSWDYLGLSFSHATNNPYPKSNMGDGIIVGVIDTGIWPESKSFSDQGLGPIPSRWKGACVGGDQFNSSHCNRKLIGARWHNKGVAKGAINTTVAMEYFSPRDAVGHGTHTASTAVGSLVHEVSFRGLALGTARGGAPRARLAVYKACWNLPGRPGACTNVDVLKAVDEAIHDGVDVLSLSLGGPALPYMASIIDIGLFQAVIKGITVVCAAGNEGPRLHTVGHVAPWIISVAASTMDRSFPSPIMLGNNRTIMGQSQFTGYKETGFRDLGCPGDFTDASSCNCEDAVLDSRMKGKVVLCFTSAAGVNNSNVNRGLVNINLSGVAGAIIAFYPTQAITCYDWHCIVVDYDIGAEIYSYTRSSRKPKVKLSPTKTLTGKPLATKIADFSSRGPSDLSPAILKPDVAAPGVSVLAAYVPQEENLHQSFAFQSGTSMACPHVSGIVALLKVLHPNWSPAAIRSALATTASTIDPSGEPIFTVEEPQRVANPFHYGNGIVIPNRAADPGLIYDMGNTDYANYLCSIGYLNSADCPSKKPSMLNLNLPSITIPNLRGSVTVTRTVTNVGSADSTYVASIEHPLGVKVGVKPPKLAFNSTVKKLSFTVTLSSNQKAIGGYYFGRLSWSDGIHKLKHPMLNLNLPLITIPNHRGSVMVTRTVTNVGPVDSVYVASIEHPLAVKVGVKPLKLAFNSIVKTFSFIVTLSSNHKAIGGYYFGRLI